MFLLSLEWLPTIRTLVVYLCQLAELLYYTFYTILKLVRKTQFAPKITTFFNSCVRLHQSTSCQVSRLSISGVRRFSIAGGGGGCSVTGLSIWKGPAKTGTPKAASADLKDPPPGSGTHGLRSPFGHPKLNDSEVFDLWISFSGRISLRISRVLGNCVSATRERAARRSNARCHSSKRKLTDLLKSKNLHLSRDSVAP